MTESKPIPTKATFIQRAPFVAMLGGCVVLLTSIVLLAAIFINHRAIRENKRRDLMGLVYYEINIQARDVSAAIDNQTSTKDDSTIVWELKNGELIPTDSDVPEPDDLVSELAHIFSGDEGTITSGLISVARELYAFKLTTGVDGKTVMAKRVDPLGIFRPNATANSLVYITDRRGTLIYSSRQMSQNIAGRELVQQFIRIPIASAQLEVSEGSRQLLGSFQNIDNTNLVYFVETDIEELDGTLTQALRKQITLMITAIIVLVILLVAPLSISRQQLLGVARAIHGMALVPGSLRLPTLALGSEFTQIAENLILLNESMVATNSSPGAISPDFNITPQPDFVEYEMSRLTVEKGNNDWLGCRLTGDGSRWVFLCFRADTSFDTGIQRGFFAGMLPALTASPLSCDGHGQDLARQLRDGILQAWNHAFGADRRLQYCFGSVERNSNNFLVLAKDYFAGFPTRSAGSVEIDYEDLSSSRIFDLRQTGFITLLPFDNLTEPDVLPIIKKVGAISHEQDIHQIRDDIESAANAANLVASALVIRVKQ